MLRLVVRRRPSSKSRRAGRVSRGGGAAKLLPALLALLALLTPEVVHAFEHGHGAAPRAVEIVDGITVHAEDCEHRGDVHQRHDASHCLVCQAGRSAAAVPDSHSFTRLQPALAPPHTGAGTLPPALLACLPLGARAPPLRHS